MKTGNKASSSYPMPGLVIILRLNVIEGFCVQRAQRAKFNVSEKTCWAF